jgi:hypothetical protein
MRTAVRKRQLATFAASNNGKSLALAPRPPRAGWRV